MLKFFKGNLTLFIRMEENMIEIERADQLLKDLSFWGCDINEAMDRLMNDKEIFFKFLYQFKKDKNFLELENAIHKNDRKNAFECAHALKGVAGNLSLKPIYESITLLVDMLKKGEMSDAKPLLKNVLEKKEELRKITDKAGLV